jgi:hypothetical protein
MNEDRNEMMAAAWEAVKEFHLAMSWFDEAREILGKAARPLSLGSRHAMDLMGLRLLQRDPEYGSETEELGELYAYAWLHTAPLADVCHGLRDGAWRAALNVPELTEADRREILGPWRETRLELAATVAAVEYTVMRKPRTTSAKESAPKTPDWVIDPLVIAYRLRLLMRDTGASRMEALWEWPYAQAMQICLAAQRWEDQWTVPKGERAKEESFVGFEMAEGEATTEGTEGHGGDFENA